MIGRSLLPMAAAWLLSLHTVKATYSQKYNQVGNSLFGSAASSETDQVLFGTTVALDKQTGTRLAVGAPQHDFRTPHHEPLAPAENAGAIFLFQYQNDTASWTRAWFLAGEPYEQIGKRFSISGSASRIAIRRYRTTPWSVEVYDTSSTNLATRQLGQTLSCGGANGGPVSISSNGNRVAVSCEYYAQSKGRVEIFDWKEESADDSAAADGYWESSGVLDGLETGDHFGWATSLSSNGDRIAISASRYDNNRGMIRIFDYMSDTQKWVLIGSIFGQVDDGRLGNSLVLSGDGKSIVAASPGASMGLEGFVQVFREASPVQWVSVGGPVYGDTSDDGFGMAVDISDDGTTFVATAYTSSHDNSRGKMSTFVLLDGDDQWTKLGDEDVQGDNTEGGFASGRYGVSITGDGSRVAVGATLVSNVGRVRVYETPTRPAPSLNTTLPHSVTTPSAVAGVCYFTVNQGDDDDGEHGRRLRLNQPIITSEVRHVQGTVMKIRPLNVTRTSGTAKLEYKIFVGLDNEDMQSSARSSPTLPFAAMVIMIMAWFMTAMLLPLA